MELYKEFLRISSVVPPFFGISPGIIQSSSNNSLEMLQSSTRNSSEATSKNSLHSLRGFLQNFSGNVSRVSSGIPLDFLPGIPQEFLVKFFRSSSRIFFKSFQKLFRISSGNSSGFQSATSRKILHWKFFQSYFRKSFGGTQAIPHPVIPEKFLWSSNANSSEFPP